MYFLRLSAVTVTIIGPCMKAPTFALYHTRFGSKLVLHNQ
jgi:hypothetical protein